MAVRKAASRQPTMPENLFKLSNISVCGFSLRKFVKNVTKETSMTISLYTRPSVQETKYTMTSYDTHFGNPSIKIYSVLQSSFMIH